MGIQQRGWHTLITNTLRSRNADFLPRQPRHTVGSTLTLEGRAPTWKNNTWYDTTSSDTNPNGELIGGHILGCRMPSDHSNEVRYPTPAGHL